MTRRSKWLIPILILCLLLMLVPCTGCTEGKLLHLLVYSIICGVQVTIDGEYQGTLGWMEEWGACVLPFVWQEGESSLEFLIPGEKIAELASTHGMQLTASQASEMPDMTLTYKGVITHDGRLEMDIYHPMAATTAASTSGLSAQNGNKPPLLGTIVVETSSEPFEPHPLVYPAMSCKPSGFTVMLNPNTACSNTMRIGNEGSITLSYSISDLGCPWLGESPTSGSVAPGDWEDITITVDASGLGPGDYSAEIVITHNDLDENPTVVPVALLINNPPNTLGNPEPVNNAAGVPINTDLSWTGGDPDAGDTVAYGVYFGSSPSPPYEGTTGPYLASQSHLTYDIGSLAHDTTYYWNIIAIDNHVVSAIGSVWDFTTQAEAGRKGDFDGDGDIDISDFVNFAAAYGSELGDNNYNPIGDFNDDGDIDIFDFVQFAAVYGT